MISPDALNSLKALTLTQRPLITAAAAVGTATAFEPGQKYEATVQAQLAPGIFKVQVGEKMLQLQLPGSFRTGDKLTLEVVSLLPRLTFNMSASSNPISTADQLSATSRLLSSLTQKPFEKNTVLAVNNAPILASVTELPETTVLADKLHNALSQSGLFYESHQAQWLAGTRNTAQLLQEPQNQSAERMKAAFDFDKNMKLANTQATADTAAVASAAPQRLSIPGVPEYMHPLIQQQLNALETSQIQWQGQIWPNQTMQWHIHEEAPKPEQGEQGRQWMTQIQLTLPKLGEVTATLRFGNGAVSLSLDAGQTDTREKLGSASSQLLSALADRGITVSSARVAKHE